MKRKKTAPNTSTPRRPGGPDPNAALEALATHAWPILSSYFTPDCCIAATRIGIAVLQRFGIAGTPIVTRPLAANALFKAWMLRRFEGDAPEGARCVDCDLTGQASDGAFPGHLVIVGKVRGRRFLLDLSAPQFDRPVNGINVPSAVYMSYVDYTISPDDNQLAVSLPGGGFLAYRAHPDPSLSYEDSPDWTIRPRHRPTYEKICASLVEAVRGEVVKAAPEPETKT